MQGICRIVCQLTPLLDRFYGIVNQHRCIFRRFRRLLCQVSHLIRYDGKSLSGFSRSCRFYGCIQRKQVGLEGNFVDRLDDSADFCRLLIDSAHRGLHFLHLPVTLDHFFLSGGGSFIRLGGIFRIFPDSVGDIVNGSRKLFDTAGLFHRTSGQILCSFSDFFC